MSEVEHCQYAFNQANVNHLWELFRIYEEEGTQCLKQALILPSYEFALKLSHIFNLLDARGALSVAQRTDLITRIRTIARESARLYLERENG